MAKLEDKLNEGFVPIGPVWAIFEELRRHFPDTQILYKFIARKIAEDGRGHVPLSTIEFSLAQRKRKTVRESIAVALAEAYQQLLKHSKIDSDDFTINPRAKGQEIVKSVRSMVPQIMSYYPFGTEKDLAGWLSEQYNIRLPLILKLFEKSEEPGFTRQVEMVYSNMDNMLKAAKRSEPHKIPPKYLLQKRSANESAETLDAFIDRAIEQLLKGARMGKRTRQRYRKTYIEPELGNFTDNKSLIKLADQVRSLYSIPEREDVYRFSVEYADLRVSWNRENIEQGKLTIVHSYLYVAAMVLKSAKIKKLDISGYLPVYHNQYKDVLESVIERLRRRGVKPNQFGVALALPLGEKPQEINLRYIKGTEPMSPHQFRALASYK